MVFNSIPVLLETLNLTLSAVRAISDEITDQKLTDSKDHTKQTLNIMLSTTCAYLVCLVCAARAFVYFLLEQNTWSLLLHFSFCLCILAGNVQGLTALRFVCNNNLHWCLIHIKHFEDFRFGYDCMRWIESETHWRPGVSVCCAWILLHFRVICVVSTWFGLCILERMATIVWYFRYCSLE